ncbi:MAG: hypothetical protein Q8M05_08820 [Rhodoferax sp.]|uniref:class I SAM-dependent DNA methyltransferase n=1 Tax=Rhodoferax sp. TaxID=50421 RepID=UPI00272F876A|nr:DNA methyltransferase [Rhodoferax sp.]MDP1529469.1 hypothetical protein [Rhodoferax sp.]MDP1943944.1 hypothetical protein [Rhodoferax sp.]
MTPQDFITKWGPGGPAFELNERQGAQPHFMDLCQLLGVPTPGSAGDYIFEQDTLVLGEARGYADVFMRNHFAWENKAPGKNLDTALKQLLTYSLALSNPPLLVVCDRLTIRIHTQFNGHPSEVHTVLLGELDQPAKQALLRRLWLEPESFRPKKTSRDITEAAAKSFATLADGLRKRDNDADEVAHFLTQCLFCFFAEDVGLLPERMFEKLVNNKQLTADKLTRGLTNLFIAMCDGGLYGNDDIPWFNGGLFKKVKVPALSIMEVTELRNAAGLNWSAIDVSIFGTLFERGLDPAKRSQLGAHYTDPATILRIIEPVLSRPLLQKWELVAQDIRTLLSKSRKKGDKHYNDGKARFVLWLEDLKAFRLLDPACGSGNFLFMGLKALKDIEHKSHLDAAMFGLDREADLVTGPHNVLGIELNEYAAELARVTVWIGELQWRMAHGYEFKTNPVLEPLDHIECRDALLTFPVIASEACQFTEAVIASEARQSMSSEPGPRAGQTPGAHKLRFLKSPPTSAPPTPLGLDSQVVEEIPGSAEMGSDPDFAQQNSGSDPTSAGVREATWPKANVVIGNPPFLGGSKKRRELGDDYFKALDTVFAGRVPGGADLVCYWFDKARVEIESNELTAAGLVSTNSIRGGSNRKVLDAIVQSNRIFEAWSDESWVNDGAAVRVSLICFGHADGSLLDGVDVNLIHADLTPGNSSGATTDLTTAHRITEAASTCFMGASKKAPFDIDGPTARAWLGQPNPNGKSNAEVLRPLCNGIDLTRRWGDRWIVDFGTHMAESDAMLFEAPYAYVSTAVRPIASKNSDKQVARNWWRHARPRVDMRAALAPLSRYIITAAVAKHRTFIWMHRAVLPDQATLATARADDTTFGILHSRFHELWSLRMGTSLEDRPRYTPTTCFETFPFPAGLTPADTAHQQTEPLESGALIPAHLQEQASKAGVVRMSGAILKSEAYEPPASEPAPPGQQRQSLNLRTNAIAIANAAKKLNDLRDNWLNPPEWTHKVPEVTPLGLDKSPYPDRIEPKPGISEQDLKALQKRTLTNLYNAKPAWLTMAHQQLDLAVAAAYGWADYTPDMSDDEILKRLLALNLARSAMISGDNEAHMDCGSGPQ